LNGYISGSVHDRSKYFDQTIHTQNYIATCHVEGVQEHKSLPGRYLVFGFPNLRLAGDLVAINLGSSKWNQRLNVPALLAESIDDGTSGRSGLCKTTDDLEGSQCVDGLEVSDYTDEIVKQKDGKRDSGGNDCTDDVDEERDCTDDLRDNDWTNVLKPDDTCTVFSSLLATVISALYLWSKSSSRTLLHQTSANTHVQDILETPREVVTSQCVEFATVMVRRTRRSVPINVPSELYIYVT
jgi:hypothetical protein